jgi:hypothetical protein
VVRGLHGLSRCSTLSGRVEEHWNVSELVMHSGNHKARLTNVHRLGLFKRTRHSGKLLSRWQLHTVCFIALLSERVHRLSFDAGLYFISSLMHFEPWHMFTSFIQYMFLLPSCTYFGTVLDKDNKLMIIHRCQHPEFVDNLRVILSLLILHS